MRNSILGSLQLTRQRGSTRVHTSHTEYRLRDKDNLDIFLILDDLVNGIRYFLIIHIKGIG